MRINKELVANATEKIGKDDFTLNELFHSISIEIKDGTASYPKLYRFIDVIKTIVSVTGIDEQKLKSRSRIRRIADVRQISMYLVHKYTRLSCVRTGELFNRDHSTVIHARKRVEDAKNGYNNDLKELLELCESCLITENEF